MPVLHSFLSNLTEILLKDHQLSSTMSNSAVEPNTDMTTWFACEKWADCNCKGEKCGCQDCKCGTVSVEDVKKAIEIQDNIKEGLFDNPLEHENYST